MLAKLFPRLHRRVSILPLLGPYLDGFVVWLSSEGYPRLPIRLRIRECPRVDALLRERGIRGLATVTRLELLGLAPRHSQEDVYLAALVRSLADYLTLLGILSRPDPTPQEIFVTAYRDSLSHVRGLSESTLTNHSRTVSDFLLFLGFDQDPAVLDRLGPRQIEAFLGATGARISRASLQHTVAHLRCFLRFLAGRNAVDRSLATSIDTPRLYRGERLPRSLSWDVVRSFLAAIDRSTPKGRRDYAMFLLIATYGLRTSEVAALTLDDIEWRAGRLRVPRPKTGTPLLLPLTEEVGATLIEYLMGSRPDLPLREVVLRVRSPPGPRRPPAGSEAVQDWARRSGLPISYQGPHCLRHSLAVHLLRQGVALKTIGDLLGHRSLESTCVYLRLHVDDLREAALELPGEARA
jgi:site-specific recombinase XerD